MFRDGNGPSGSPGLGRPGSIRVHILSIHCIHQTESGHSETSAVVIRDASYNDELLMTRFSSSTSVPQDTDTLNSGSLPSNERGKNPNLGDETTGSAGLEQDMNSFQRFVSHVLWAPFGFDASYCYHQMTEVIHRQISLQS